MKYSNDYDKNQSIYGKERLNIFMTFSIVLSLFCFGLLIGAISPVFGIGGGILTVPILIIFFGMNTDWATATSLGVIIFTSLSGTLAYMREKRIDYRIASIFIICAIPGAVIGAYALYWLKQVSSNIDLLQVIYAIFMMSISLTKFISLLIYRRSENRKQINEEKIIRQKDNHRRWWQEKYFYNEIIDRRGIVFNYTVRLYPGVLVAFFGGFLGSLLGLGGGVIYVPILTMVLGIPFGIATATSTFTIFLANFFAVYIRFASIQWQYVLWLSLGSVISAVLATRFLYRINSTKIQAGFWILTTIAAVRLILKVLGFSL